MEIITPENNQTEKVLVSIITPLHNSASFIHNTIISVINQTISEWELLVIDDCSTDNGASIVDSYMKSDVRIRLLKNEKNLGPALTRNRGIMEAKGRYIAFLDSDDTWLPQKLEIQLEFMKKRNVPFTFTYYEQIDEKGAFLRNMDYFPEKVDYRSTMMSNKIGCLTAIYDTQYFGKEYMVDIRNRQDYTLWLKLLKKVKYAYCVPEMLAQYRVRKGSISSNKWKLVKYHWKIYRHIEKQSFFNSLYYISNYIALRLLRK